MHGAASRKHHGRDRRGTHADSVSTAEIESTASSSERVARRLTKTGTNVAVRIPPSTRSCTMFGVLLARLNESDKVRVPEGVDGDEDPQETGDAREQRADRDVGGRRAETGPARRLRACSAAREAPERRAPAIPRPDRPAPGFDPGQAGRGRDSRQGAGQAPSIDRPMASAAVGGLPPAPHEAGSGTVPGAGSWRWPGHARRVRRRRRRKRGPQPPEEQERTGSDGQPDRDSRDRRGADGGLLARQARGRRSARAVAS